MLEFLPLGATGTITHSLLAQDDVAAGPIFISGHLPYSSGQVNTAYVRVLLSILFIIITSAVVASYNCFV